MTQLSVSITDSFYIDHWRCIIVTFVNTKVNVIQQHPIK